LVFPSTSINTGGYYNASTGRFTAPVAGAYLIAAQMFVSQTGTSQANIKINDTADVFELKCVTNEGAYQAVSSSKVVYLNAGDFVLYRASSGSALSGAPFTFLSGYLIG
jgi:hypothetical protein